MIRKKMINSALSITFAALALAGCGTANQANTGTPTASAPSSSTASSEPTELVVSTWGNDDFTAKEVIAPFEKKFNVKVVFEIGNNADRLNKVQQKTSNVDVLFLSDYFTQQAIDADLIEKIDRAYIPNLDQLYDIAKAPLGADYGPAFTINQLGIAYNPKLVKTEITSWKDLWNPELAKKLTMPGITTTTGPMLLDAASLVSGSSTFNEDQAFAKLKELNPSVVKYYGKTSDFVTMFAQGEIAAGPFMQGFLKDLLAGVPDAKFVTPEEGGYAVMNTVNVVKGSKNKELAEELINWYLSKEIQEKLAKAKINSPTNKEVKLTEEEAEGLTYGADMISKLRYLDVKYVNENLKKWTDRWNREIAQ
ncbi:ABC transporter substrate-binding protein [Paenibacillus zanthoxyli]|uniref:ABC transporter substrate-binding protein n=1 Tax=Paenibacillus zanthoxyli TaxID=369399 RepID=UPI0004B66045|nr:ABC transporter substrate-binding protein [Paenibacillus zanthoxyli]